MFEKYLKKTVRNPSHCISDVTSFLEVRPCCRLWQYWQMWYFPISFLVIMHESSVMDLQLIAESCLRGDMYGLRITESHLGCDAASYSKWFFTFQRKMKVTHSFTVLGSTCRVIQRLVPNDQSRMLYSCKSIKTHICGKCFLLPTDAQENWFKKEY